MIGMEGKMPVWGKYEVWYHSVFLNWKSQLDLMDSGEWIWPFSAHERSVHMIMSVHVGEPVPVWHAASGLKEPTLWAWSLTISHYSSSPQLISHYFPLIIPLPLSHLAAKFLSLSGAPSACGPLRESWGAAQYSNVAFFMSFIVRWSRTTKWLRLNSQLATIWLFWTVLIKQMWYWSKASWDYWNSPMV